MLESWWDKMSDFKKNVTKAFFQERCLPIEIFVRHCHYSSAGAHKKRFENFCRERCLHNLLSTISGHQKINVTFLLDTYHPMQEAHFLYRQSLYPIIEFKAGSEAASFLYMLEHVYRQKFPPETILYFLEDDYVHRPGWPKVLREAFTLSGIDYVTLFDHRDKYFLPQYTDLKSKIFYTDSCHWRTTPSTTNTYALFFKTLQKHIDIHRCFSLGRTITADHDKFCKLSEQEALLVSSIPGYSSHAEPQFASPCHDWEKILQEIS
jgi:hypothetical protein